MSLVLFGAFDSAVLAHLYDTGLPKPQRTLIREAIVRRLQPLLKVNGGYLGAIVELPKPIRSVDGDSDDRSMLFEALNGRGPGVAIALGRRTTRTTGGLATEAEGTLEVSVYVMSQHGRDLVTGRLANDIRVEQGALTLDPGIETILEHVEQLLQGHTPRDADGETLPSVRELRGTDEDEIGTYADITMWRQEYELGIERVINPARAVTQQLLSIQGLHREAGTAALADGSAPDITPITTLATLSPPEAP